MKRSRKPQPTTHTIEIAVFRVDDDNFRATIKHLGTEDPNQVTGLFSSPMAALAAAEIMVPYDHAGDITIESTRGQRATVRLNNGRLPKYERLF